MKRNVILGLMKVDWSDKERQNEFVNSVVSALNSQGESLEYDYVCAVSGSAFRTSFSIPTDYLWNHGNYNVLHAPIIIEHTFKMLGYGISHHIRSSFETDKKLIMESIDKGKPVITLNGVIHASDACLISGYDNDGDVLLGYSPFMHVEDDHNEGADDTGYFRKSDWHNGFFSDYNNGRIIIIEAKGKKPSDDEILKQTLKLVRQLIENESIALGQYNGLAAHRAFAKALQTYEWDDNFEPYLNVMCNYKQYLDRQYAVQFFYDNRREDLAKHYERITDLCKQLGRIIPQDFSAEHLFSDKNNLKPYCDVLLKIHDLEKETLTLL